MNKRVVMACLGDAASTTAIRRQSESAAVIALVLDLSGAVNLRDACDAARAAGAVRCHVLDLREEFLRDVVLPALACGGQGTDAELDTVVAPAFINAKLRQIAVLENAAWEDVTPATLSPPRRRLSRVVTPARVDISVDNGVPVAVNGVDMSLSELIDILEVITGEPALTVLSRHLPAAAAAGDAAREVRDHQAA